MKKLLLLLLLVSYCLVLAGCNSYEPNTPHAVKYEVFQSETSQIAGKRLCEQYVNLLVLPEKFEGLTQENIAHTAMKAAWEAYDSARPNVPDVVVVWIPQHNELVGKGYVLGKAVFSQSGKGLDGADCPRWDVKAVKQTSFKQIQANVLYEQHKGQYESQRLKRVIASKVDIPESQIPFPSSPENYAIK